MKKSPLNHCDSEMMHSGGWGQVRKYNSQTQRETKKQ